MYAARYMYILFKSCIVSAFPCRVVSQSRRQESRDPQMSSWYVLFIHGPSDRENIVTNLLQNLFVVVFLSDTEMVPLENCLSKRSTWINKNTKSMGRYVYIGISRQTGNGRIWAIVLAPDSDPRPWSPTSCLVQDNVCPQPAWDDDFNLGF